MKINFELSRFIFCILLSLFIFNYGILSQGEDIAINENENTKQITNIVKGYCDAWISGDMNLMYKYFYQPSKMSFEDYHNKMEAFVKEKYRPLCRESIKVLEIKGNESAVVEFTLKVPSDWKVSKGLASYRANLKVCEDGVWRILHAEQIKEPKIKGKEMESIKEIVIEYCNALMSGDLKGQLKHFPEEVRSNYSEYEKNSAFILEKGNYPLRIIKIKKPFFLRENTIRVECYLKVPKTWKKNKDVAKVIIDLVKDVEKKVWVINKVSG